jgi:hypothetical protein
MGAFFSIFGSRNRSANPRLQTTLTQNSPLKSPYTGYVSPPKLQSTLSQSITGVKPSMASMLNSPDVKISLAPSTPSVVDFATSISQSTLAPSNQDIKQLFISSFTPVGINNITGKKSTFRMPTVPPRATHFASAVG